MGELTWSQVRREAAAEIGDVDARWLVEEAAPDLDGPVTTHALAHFDAMLARRRAGEPLQYVLGHWAFRSLDLLVDRRVLIPRPETEIVADVAITELRRLEGSCALDLGTGSGAIALSIATEVPGVDVWAVDRSADAIDVARANVAGIGRPGARVRLVEGDWYAALPDELRGGVDVIVSNPPYVADSDELPPIVRDWEPGDALLAGADGLDDIRRIVVGAPDWFRATGALVVEIAPHQADEVRALARDAGFGDVDIRHDLAARPRVLLARR